MAVDLESMSDDELNRRIMMLLKKTCDRAGMAYPPKLVAYIAANEGREPTASG